MKKIYLAVFLACSMGGAVQAQISEGGLPWSMSLKNTALAGQEIPKANLIRPDYEAQQKEDAHDALVGAAKPYRVAAYVSSDISLNNGVWSYLENGSKIWRMSIAVPDAKAIGVFYDKFNLPSGVKFYLFNKKGNQIIGAYSEKNNTTAGNFVNEEVIGDVVTLEMNVAQNVSVKDIQFHINKVTAYYRGVSALEERFGQDDAGTAAKPTGIGDASPCHINANCPAGADPAFAKAKAASVQVTMGNSVCSGTLINSTGNQPNGGTCNAYLLTASHCEATDSRTDNTYSNWVFRFNFQSSTCEGSNADDGYVTRAGATFKARSRNPSFSDDPDGLVSDFLLLQMTSTPPATAYLAGWNRNTNIANNADYERFISFHHPAGDLKKLAFGTQIDAAGSFNQDEVPNTHWTSFASVGGSEGGSSGSGLFDQDGLLIGDLSGGQPGTGPCAPMNIEKLYSKISVSWENAFDQTNWPNLAGPQSRLKDWLDPLNINNKKWGAAKFDCSDAPTSVSEMEQILEQSIVLFPNPSTGIVSAKMNFADITDLNVEVFNVVGAKQKSFELKKVRSGQYTFDLSSLPSGVYLFNISSSNASIGKRVTIVK